MAKLIEIESVEAAAKRWFGEYKNHLEMAADARLLANFAALILFSSERYDSAIRRFVYDRPYEQRDDSDELSDLEAKDAYEVACWASDFMTGIF